MLEPTGKFDSNPPLVVISEGSGIPLLILTTGLPLLFKRTFSSPELREFLTFHIVDVLTSERPVDQWTIESILSDLDETRAGLGTDKGALLGASGTVLLALMYAIRFPERISHLILLNAGAFHWETEEYKNKQQEHWAKLSSKEWKEMLEVNRRNLAAKDLSALPFGENLTAMANAESPWFMYDPEFDWSPLCGDAVGEMSALLRFWDLFDGIDLREALDTLSMPTFIGVGRYDFQNPPSIWDGA